MNTLSEANGTFAIHLFKILSQNNPSKNVCYSPVSISSALAMVLLGAKGDTAVQMSQTLGLNTEEDIHRGFQWLLKNLNKPERKYLHRMANRIFADNTCELPPTYKESCLQFYHSELEQLSFAKDPEESRKHINTWVSKQTEELLSDGSVDSATRLVLVNALYFKGKWHQQFYKENTEEMPFKINQSEKRPVQMMYQEDTFNHASVNEVQAQVLVMPYEGMELSLVVLLPDDSVELSKVENNLTFEKLTAWTKPDYMKRIYIKVFLPKFKMEENYEMGSMFQHLRMVDLFQRSKADSSAMPLEKDLHLSKFVHKSVVEVNEEGTEATAASAIISFNRGHRPALTFFADRPFLFFIRHNETNSLLFSGRLCMTDTLSEANGTFAIHLLKILCQNNPSKNALCLNTEKEILQGFQGLLSNLNESNRKYSLRVANRLFAETTCELFPTYKESCLQFYHLELEQLSFVKAPEESRKHINMWVSKQTEGKIPELLSGDSVDSVTSLVLVNALYFKGRCQKRFDEVCTRKMPFKISQSEKRPVQMMCQEGVFNIAYVNEEKAKVLVMLYEGMERSLVVLLPVDGVDLSKHLGMVDVFQDVKADLSGISPERDLCVHKSVVEVNEEGTEAAASTMVSVVAFSSAGVPKFCADHPFLFFIRHNETNSLLFCGGFSSPSAHLLCGEQFSIQHNDNSYNPEDGHTVDYVPR